MSNKTSDKNVVNIEDDVNKIKEIIKRCEDFNKNLGYESEIYDGDTPFPYKELEHILTERKQDKKRIQELEEENRIYVLEGNRVKLELYIKENYTLKQKVIEALDDIYDYLERLNGPDEDIEYIENKRKELLEE